MRTNFDAILRETWRHEGGYVDDARDAGGATKYGVTIATLSAWRKRPVTKAEVQALTREEAADIYRAWYWQPIKGDDLPPGIDAIGFDAAVNSGVSRSAKWLQGAAGVTQDGLIGPQTLAALRAADPAVIIDKALASRLAFMKAAKNTKTGALLWPTYKKGWTRRLDELRAFAAHLAAEAAAPPPPKPAILPRPVDPHISDAPLQSTDPDTTIIRPAALFAAVALAAVIAVYVIGG